MAPGRGLWVVMVMGGLATACAASGRTYVAEEPPAPTSTNLVQLDFEDRAAPVGEIVPSVENTGKGRLYAEIVTHAGGRILRAEGSGSGYALRFPGLEGGLDPPAAMLLLRSQDTDDFLSPGSADFAFGADVLLDEESEDAPTDNGNNVVQRGLYVDTAQYKLQVDHGAFSCRVAGSEGEAVVSASGVVEPGEWYRVSCERRDGGLLLTWERLADSETGTETSPATIGDVTFPEGTPFVVGGKLDARGEVTVDATDQFNGVIDNVWFTLQDS
jgi:laminin G domain protein